MELDAFTKELFHGLEAGLPEIAVGQAAGLRKKGEAAFESMNRP
jgi:hypothetical protein